VISVVVVVVAALLAPPRAHAQQQVTANVVMRADRTNVAVGERFGLQIRADVSGAEPTVEPPDLSPFQIVESRVVQPVQLRFGFGAQTQIVQSTVVHDYTLVPLREGRVEIAPARVRAGGRTFTSNGVALDVGPGTVPPTPDALRQGPDMAPPSGPLDGAVYDGQAFLRTVVDQPAPYVGQQVTVTVYLYVRGPIRSTPIVHREPDADGFWVQDLMPPNRTLEPQRQVVGNVPFNVYVLRRFAAFPLSEGEQTIGGMSLSFETGSLFDLFNPRPGGALRRDGVPVAIHVKPLPAEGRPTGEVAVGRFELAARLDRTEVATGDAVTLTATVEGVGNVRDVELVLPPIDGVRVLAPEVRDEVRSPNDLVGGTRTYEWLLVPEQPGAHPIPPFSVSTFQPETATYQRIESAPLTLTAAGSAITSDDGETSAGQEGSAGEDENRPPELPPVRTRSELDREHLRLTSELFYWIAVAVPPLFFFGFVVLAIGRRRASAARERNAPRRAFRDAKRRLHAAEAHATRGDAKAFYGEIRKVLRDVLEARLGEAVGGYTWTELRSHLAARGMDEDLGRRVVDELEGSELAAFSAVGASDEEIKNCAQRIGALLERMDRFVPAAGTEARR
jgi:hypothetical protein